MYGHRDAGFFGYSHFTGGYAGGQAEYVRVPKGNVNLLKIPDGVSDEKALYLSDVLPTAYHNVVDTGVKEGDVVGIWVSRHVGSLKVRVAKWHCSLGSWSDWSTGREVCETEGGKENHRDRQVRLQVEVCARRNWSGVSQFH